jgi:urease accessory protein
VNGALHLVCAPDTMGRSTLVSQYVSAPMHISKPWWNEGLLIVNAINSTAGLFSGDSIETSFDVKAGAQMLVTSPSANRAHRMPSGMATVRQSIHVGSSGWLEFWPSLFIPHTGSNYRQEISIRLEPDARLLWFETFAPGRVASGEAWEFTRYQNQFDLTYDSRLVARETYSLTPDSPSVAAFRSQFPTGYHATCYAAGIDFPDDLLSRISALYHPDCWVGCTRLDAPAIAIRLAAADSLHLSRALTNIRELLHHSFGRCVPALRRF